MQLFQPSTVFRSKDDVKGEDVFVNAVRPESTLLNLPMVAGTLAAARRRARRGA